jgi:hypothetical protein
MLSGRVIVRLHEARPYPALTDLSAFAREAGIAGLADILREFGIRDARRLVRLTPIDRVLELERAAERHAFKPLRSLAGYWRLELRNKPESFAAIIKRLKALPAVASVYLDSDVVPATINPPGHNPLAPSQGYLDAAPNGIDARWAWTQTHGGGAGVRFFDVEAGWHLGHEDIAPKAPLLIVGDNRELESGAPAFNDGNHGSAVLGIVAGADNLVGVCGIAPNLSTINLASVWDKATSTPGHVVDAVLAAIFGASPGDVMLLEVQTGRGHITGWPDFHPIEIKDAEFDAIRLAVAAKNMIVIEAAGNGGTNLDGYVSPQGIDQGKKVLARNAAASFRDSGAVLVGAAQSATRQRRFDSNFGSRVDCFAWGESITTCLMQTPLFGSSPVSAYRNDFGGTSGASAIIAGAAVVMQSLHSKSGTAPPLAAPAARAILADAATGTSSNPPTAAIGVMPNLRNIATRLGLLPDVYLRDALGDDGAVPSTGVLASSPDIIVRLAASTNPNGDFGTGSGYEDDDALSETLTYGADAFVHLRMRNRGGGDAQQVTGRVWWSPPATLVTPNLWQPIVDTSATSPQTTTAPVDVLANGPLVVTPALRWPAVPVNGHCCLVAIVGAASDPAPVTPASLVTWDNFVSFVRDHNNVTWRNINTIAPPPTPNWQSGEFLITGAPGEDRIFSFRFELRLPELARAYLELPRAFVDGIGRSLPLRRLAGAKIGLVRLELPQERSVTLENILLPTLARIPARFVLRVADPRAAQGAEIAIRQFDQRFEVGRLTWRFVPKRRRR